MTIKNTLIIIRGERRLKMAKAKQTPIADAEVSKKKAILNKIYFYFMMQSCGRDDMAKQSILEAIKLIEEAEIK